MDLSNLKPAKGATHKERRLGRGVGSGTGGHSSTRGNKGQKSRSGNHKMPVWFEGGQMPLQRRLPKFGFTSPFRKEYVPVNLSRLSRLVEDGKLSADAPVTPAALIKAGVASKNDRIKILGGGELDRSLDVRAHAFSGSAREKIEAAGGSVTTL